MKVPVRKLKALVQYSVLGGLVVTVVYVFANFKEAEKLKKTSSSDDPEEEVWASLKQKVVEASDNPAPEVIPRLPSRNVGIEHIQEDSLPDMVDWHNYTLIRTEKERVGPGEQGKPLVISKEEESNHDSLFRSNGFSGYASDLISVSHIATHFAHFSSSVHSRLTAQCPTSATRAAGPSCTTRRYPPCPW